MRPASRPRGVACTSVLPMRYRASATVDTGSERRVRRGIGALFDGITGQLGMLAGAMHSKPMRSIFTALACGVLAFTAVAQTPTGKATPKPATPAQPATRPAPARPPAAVAAPAAPPRIPYPDWLFPTEPELLKPPPGNPPKEPPKETKLDDQELLTI